MDYSRQGPISDHKHALVETWSASKVQKIRDKIGVGLSIARSQTTTDIGLIFDEDQEDLEEEEVEIDSMSH